MPSFRPIIGDAYREILAREADASGLESYNGLMNQGMSEEDMRESLLRSAEYARKNPLNLLAPRVGLNVHVPSNTILNDVALNLHVPWIRVDSTGIASNPSRVCSGGKSGTASSTVRSISGSRSWPRCPTHPPGRRPTRPILESEIHPPRFTFWTDIAREALTRYRGRIFHWQFWNEPNVDQFLARVDVPVSNHDSGVGGTRSGGGGSWRARHRPRSCKHRRLAGLVRKR